MKNKDIIKAIEAAEKEVHELSVLRWQSVAVAAFVIVQYLIWGL